MPKGGPPAVHCGAIDEEGRKGHPDCWEGTDKRTYGSITDTGAVWLWDPRTILSRPSTLSRGWPTRWPSMHASAVWCWLQLLPSTRS